jgi:hypothetical protein
MRKSSARAFYQTYTAIALKLGISKSAVCQWPDRVPIARAFQLEHDSNGGVKVDKTLYPGKKMTRFVVF